MALTLSTDLPIRADLAGLFISRGTGTHPDRIVDFHEVIFVREGTLFIAEAGRPFAVKAGQALLLFPGQRHWGFEPYQKELSFYWMHFYLRDTSGSQHLVLPRQVDVQRPDHLSTLFRRLLDEQSNHPGSAMTRDLLALLVLDEISRFATPMDQRGQMHRIASEAQTHIVLHHQEHISTSSIARALGYHQDYLGRCFRQVHGQTITEAIRQHRIRKACVLLLETRHTIEEVSRLCGFTEVICFRRVFKHLQGVTPSAYRKLHARLPVNTE